MLLEFDRWKKVTETDFLKYNLGGQHLGKNTVAGLILTLFQIHNSSLKDRQIYSHAIICYHFIITLVQAADCISTLLMTASVIIVDVLSHF